MVETIKHLFGFCGEGHPNLLLGLGVAQFVVFKTYFKNFFKYITLCLKTFLLLFWR
jgi:hypothetical protein